MRKIQNLFIKSKPLAIILFCIFIISSCKKPDNPCSLTPEQAPEIRGIKLGMSYDEISEKFRAKCNLKVIKHDPNSRLDQKVRYSIDVADADWQNKTASKDSEKYDLKGLDTGCFTYLGNNVIGFSPTKFPELEGINSLRLSFDEGKLIVGIDVSYALKNKDGKFTFQELINSLDLSKWTNWHIEPEKPYIRDIKMLRGTLLCNDLVIESSIFYFSSDGGTYSVNLDIKAVTNDELIFTKNAIEKAQKDEEQKKRDEAENSNAAQKKRMEEENKVREPFKP